MARKNSARERILEIAEACVLAKGFEATSIDEIIVEAGITKSGFFYHFRDKNELAREMVRRFVDENEALFDEVFRRGRELSDDPLQAFLIALKLLAEILADVQARHPGCLIASICYQERLFDRELVETVREVSRSWHARFSAQLEEIASHYTLAPGMDVDALAESMICIIDGAIILAKMIGEPARLERQVLTYRAIVRNAFGEPVRRPMLVAAE